MTNLEYLLVLKNQLEGEIKETKSRIQYKEECIKILDELIEKEQQNCEGGIGLAYLSDLRERSKKEMDILKPRIQYRQERIKILDELIRKEQQI